MSHLSHLLALNLPVRAIQEATNDSGLLLQISQIGAAKARAMKSGSGAFDVDDFVARLITYMGGRKPVSPVGDEDEEEDESEYDAGGAPLDWERIARRALAKSRRVPAMDFMCVLTIYWRYAIRSSCSKTFVNFVRHSKNWLRFMAGCPFSPPPDPGVSD